MMRYAFRGTLGNSDPVQVFLIRRGREPLSADINLSRTVNGFIPMHLFRVAGYASNHQMRVVREVKNAQRRIPDRGWFYFTSRFPSC